MATVPLGFLSTATFTTSCRQHLAGCWRSQYSRTATTLHTRRNSDDNVVLEVLESAGSLLTRDVHIGGFFQSIPLGIPLTLSTATIILPFSTSILLITFCLAYIALIRSIGNNVFFNDVVDEEVDRFTVDDKVEEGEDKHNFESLDAVALFGAVASVGLLSPLGFSVDNGPGSVVSTVALGLAGLSIYLSLLGNEEGNSSLDNSENMIMENWDVRLKQENDQENKKKDK